MIGIICAMEKECRSPPISASAQNVMMIRNSSTRSIVSKEVHTESMLPLSIYLIPLEMIKSLPKPPFTKLHMISEKTPHKKEKAGLIKGSCEKRSHTFLKNSFISLTISVIIFIIIIKLDVQQ